MANKEVEWVHNCRKKPDKALFQDIEWKGGVWSVTELRGSIFIVSVPIRVIRNGRCPWRKLKLPTPESGAV